MSRRFHRGLVVGKFAPLHRGHQAVIEHAMRTCDDVLLLSYSKPELPGCPPSERRRWLAELYPTLQSLVVDDPWLEEHAPEGFPFRQLPENDAPVDMHRRFCAALCEVAGGDPPDAVFTSEAYGPGFACALEQCFGRGQVAHVEVDIRRERVPISGTRIRADPSAHRAWLAPTVFSSFMPRVALLGAESTGKSVLAAALAERLGTVFVPEFGREHWLAREGRLAFDDMLLIAREQVGREVALAHSAHGVLVCDTSPLTTRFYSETLFGRLDPELARLSRRSYDLIVFCQPDFPFVQDGTRTGPSFSDRQHRWHVNELSWNQSPVHIASGSLEVRVRTTLDRIAQCPSLASVRIPFA
ncbi:MAG: AAA family ATPase [Phycisphaerae bacterium]|nr:AAA family ATPase [Phycisphaerae bacterium]